MTGLSGMVTSRITTGRRLYDYRIGMEKLEREILDWIAAATDDESLQTQLANAEAVRRDYTRTGYFTYFSVPEGLPPIAGGLRPPARIS